VLGAAMKRSATQSALGGSRTGLAGLLDQKGPESKVKRRSASERSLRLRVGGGQKGGPITLPVGWVPTDDMDRRDWIQEGRKFGTISRCSQWWIGDWLRFGNTKWGEKYTEAARITGYDAGSLRNMASIASQFDLSLRSDKLSYSHHVLIAPLEDGDKSGWIERAIKDRLSVADLRLELKASRPKGSRPHAREDESASGSVGKRTMVCPHCGGAIPSEN